MISRTAYMLQYINNNTNDRKKIYRIMCVKMHMHEMLINQLELLCIVNSSA